MTNSDEHAYLPPSILPSMVYRIDLRCGTYPGQAMASLTVHRILTASATVTNKA